MVGFHNNVGSAPMANWVSQGANQIAFGRGKSQLEVKDLVLRACNTGTLGYVAINNADTAWNANFATSLPDDIYCDVITGSVSNGKCTGVAYVPLFFSSARCL